MKVIITGGARGIGAALVAHYAADAANTVVFLDKSAEGVAAALANAPANVSGFVCDTTDAAACTALMERICAEGPADVLVNNAGITQDRTFAKMSAEEWDAVLNVNLKAVFNTTQPVYRAMLERRSGRIVNIASVVGLRGNFGQSNYAASKAGIIGFTKTLALECAAKGVTVNAVAPGFIATEMTRAMPQQAQDAMRAMIPMGRFGTVDDVVNAVAFLTAPASDYITGQTLSVNGGLYFG